MSDPSDYPWIVLVIIIGSGGLVLCCYAVLRFYRSDESDGVRSRGDEQREYMREVRERNFTFLEWTAWSGRGGRVCISALLCFVEIS
jgi:hypothetical protein